MSQLLLPHSSVGNARLGFERVLCWGGDEGKYRHRLRTLLIFQEERLARYEQEGLEQDRGDWSSVLTP